MTTSFVITRRSTRQLRATLVRIAQAASQIHALYERYGPDEPWGFADPSRLEVLAALLRALRALPRRRRAVGASAAAAEKEGHWMGEVEPGVRGE